mmetsp:Transcript_56301/g.163283  ORF Transcript_56301/g.163283 Transcript_56301/m.163283 type:complete len:908 (+) Transcript_56301:107-2830(+)|eukprot:CAMPEP_0176031500 /NCGR_PEP_ID=MMETSP0120_2-20121206/15528_1 /TAXON_ID=160619 /ORGANISM="Kryptoperidinium foliaceum, Strain CCMP 1326" /LENGTH=907 /DNA_ID=CAMNT_0017364789 /DNA_START=56 /DNA_END=2779 /DNA_ORIENTATION=-
MQWLGTLFGVREEERGGASQEGRSPPRPQPTAADRQDGASSVRPESRHEFDVGALVEYHSSSQRAWIPAKVVAQLQGGAYDLDCRPGVAAERVRAPQRPEFEPQAVVEYESRQGWILTRVVSYNSETGRYTLACRPEARPEKIRRPRRESRGAASYASTGAGAEAEAGLASQGASLEPIEELGEDDLRSPERLSARSSALEADAVGEDVTRSGGQGADAVHEEAAEEEEEEGESQEPGEEDAAEEEEAAAEEGGAGALSRRQTPSASSRRSFLHRSAHIAPQEAPLQLVRVLQQGDAWQILLCEEAMAQLEALGRRPVSVCALCGPRGAGKSRLLNLLIGRMQRGWGGRFHVGSAPGACTEGVWMWSSGWAGGDGPSLLFLDCEGFDGEAGADAVRERKLMSLCSLLSTVLVLNTHGVPDEGLFAMLASVFDLAEFVDEPRSSGDSAGRPALLWILHDLERELVDEEGQPMASDNYLEHALRARALEPPSADPQRGRSAAGGVDVREKLLRSFHQRGCVALAPPGAELPPRPGGAQPGDASVPAPSSTAFRRSLDAAEARLLDLVRSRPKVLGPDCGGQPLGGAALAALLRRLVETLNAGERLHLGDAWAQAWEAHDAELQRELRERGLADLRRFREGGPLPGSRGARLPVRDEVLQRALQEGIWAPLERDWEDRALGDEAARSQSWARLASALAEEERLVEQKNQRLAEAKLAAAGADWETWLRGGEAPATDPRSEALALLLDSGLPSRPVAHAAREALHAARMARLHWESSQDALRAELRLLTAELRSKTEAAAALRRDDGALTQTREVGRLQGQVEALQSQAREALAREKALRDQVLEAEEGTRREQREKSEVARRCKELEQQVRRLEGQISDLKAADRERHIEFETSLAKRREQRPQCGCTAM